MGVTYSQTATQVFAALFGPRPPVLLDVRKAEVIAESGRLFPGAIYADQADGPRLAGELDRNRSIVVACAHGHNRSQLLAAHLRSEGFEASGLAGGYDGWLAAGLPTVLRTSRGLARDIVLGGEPTTWITRWRPKVDRTACPWLITRFLDPGARFLYADPEWVLAIAEQTGAVAYDIPGAPLEHDGPRCTFDALLRAFGLESDPHLAELATIVRGADTARLDLHPAAPGLLSALLGLSSRHGEDDHAMLKNALVLFDALYCWIRLAKSESHSWQPPVKERAL